MRKGKNIYKRKDGRWEGRYIIGRDDSGKAKYRSVYAKTYSECARKLDESKKVAAIPRNPMTVAELFTAWHESRKNLVKQSTYMNYENLYDLYVSGSLGHKQVNRLTAIELNTYAAELLEHGGKHQQGLSAKTVQTVIIILKAMFRFGEKNYQLHNPASEIVVPKCEIKEPDTFTKSEIKAIKETTIQSTASAFGVLLCLYCGLRIGEVCGLMWSDIDLTAHTLKVIRTVQRIHNPDGNYPKTKVVIHHAGYCASQPQSAEQKPHSLQIRVP